MFYIPPEVILNQTFQAPRSQTDPTITDFTCTGYGQNPDKGTTWFVGKRFDSQNNRTEVSTHLLKDVKFVGKLPDASLKS